MVRVPDRLKFKNIAKVVWYCTKADLNTNLAGIPHDDAKFIHENELFMTKYSDFVWVDSIHSKIIVHSFDDFECLDDYDIKDYFS